MVSNHNPDAYADPFLQNARPIKPLPTDVRLVCSYELEVQGVWEIEQAVFFRRTQTADELWLASGETLSIIKSIADGTASPHDLDLSGVIELGCVLAVPKQGEESTACLQLLDEVTRSRVGFYMPTRFFVAGMVNESGFNKMTGQISLELKNNSAKAKESESEIIEIARELGLNPVPTGRSPQQWTAACPGTNHNLDVNSAANSFGCGWCKKKGGPDELRIFVSERRQIDPTPKE